VAVVYRSKFLLRFDEQNPLPCHDPKTPISSFATDLARFSKMAAAHLENAWLPERAGVLSL
jgi:hypothetical protein